MNAQTKNKKMIINEPKLIEDIDFLILIDKPIKDEKNMLPELKVF